MPNFALYFTEEILRQSHSDLASLLAEHQGKDAQPQDTTKTPASGISATQQKVEGQDQAIQQGTPANILQSTPVQRPPTRQPTPAHTQRIEGRQTLDINVPSLQLAGDDVNEPLDLSTRQETTDWMR